jgi:hypothetical protein
MDLSARFPGYTSGRVLTACGASKFWMIQVIKHGSRPSPELAMRIEAASGRAILRGDLLPDIWPDHVSPPSPDLAA